MILLPIFLSIIVSILPADPIKIRIEYEIFHF